VFERWREKLAQVIAPPVTPRIRQPLNLARMYAAAKASRLTTGWGQLTSSEDAELSTSLRTMRNRSRELIRDSAYAKRAKVIVQNNVVGSGIGLQAKIENTRGSLNQRINDDIETQWERWCEAGQCHTGGALHFPEFERAVMGQTFEAGEIFVRKHYRAFGESAVPFALELIEPERLADEFQPSPSQTDTQVRLGVEVDAFHRPVAYWIRSLHPGEVRLTAERSAMIERVLAQDVLHLRLIDRWPQTRGVPWLHAAMRRLNDMDGLGEAEIVAARAAACYMGFIELPNAEESYGEQQADGSTQSELQPAMIERLKPGEKFNFAAPNRPNANLDPFMRMMLREVAAGVGASYESLSRDYSQSNYSSSRLALLDDRDLWRMLQKWFIRSFRSQIHRAWLQQAVLARAITSINLEAYALNPMAYEAARFKARGWNWVDPTKEVEAYKEAIRCGFTTVSRVIEQTGNGDDLEDIIKERENELALMHEHELIFDTDPAVDGKGVSSTPAPPAPTDPANPTDATDPAVAQAEKMLRAVTPIQINLDGKEIARHVATRVSKIIAHEGTHAN
jgi:lambda family phage portal protein